MKLRLLFLICTSCSTVPLELNVGDVKVCICIIWEISLDMRNTRKYSWLWGMLGLVNNPDCNECWGISLNARNAGKSPLLWRMPRNIPECKEWWGISLHARNTMEYPWIRGILTNIPGCEKCKECWEISLTMRNVPECQECWGISLNARNAG